MSSVVAAVAVGAAVLLVFGPSPSRNLQGSSLAVVGLAALAVGWVGFAHGLRLPLLAIAAAGVWAAHRQVQNKRARLAADRRAASVIDVCEGLAADLRAGQPPLLALHGAAREWPEFSVVADAGRLGGDVPLALRRLAESPGAQGLRAVAAAWVIAHRSGAGLADAVALAARSIREDRATARIVETEMASARATARLLAVLPIGVLLIGRGTGGDPFAFLFGSTAGLVCLGGGMSLSWAGLAWLERIGRSGQG